MLGWYGSSLQAYELPIPDPHVRDWRINRDYDLTPQQHQDIADNLLFDLNPEQLVINKKEFSIISFEFKIINKYRLRIIK
jgi:hypothetical protein